MIAIFTQTPSSFAQRHRRLLRRLRKGESLMEMGLALMVWFFVIGQVTLNENTRTRRDVERAILQDYVVRLASAMSSYAQANATTLENTTSSPTIAAVSASQALQTVTTTSPLGQTPSLYAVGAATAVTLYAVLPMTGIYDGENVGLDLADHLGAMIAVVESGQIVSPTGNWSVPTSTIAGTSLKEGDLLVRILYVQPPD